MSGVASSVPRDPEPKWHHCSACGPWGCLCQLPGGSEPHLGKASWNEGCWGVQLPSETMGLCLAVSAGLNCFSPFPYFLLNFFALLLCAAT